MKHLAIHRTITISLLAFTFSALPGCIVADIHDELKGVNARLERVEETLDKIDTTNEQLALLQARLDTLDHLESIDAELDPIKGSLENLDAHLASLRKTISSIDSTIPFLKFSDDDEAEPGPGEDAEPAGAEK